jgi:glutaredoxin
MQSTVGPVPKKKAKLPLSKTHPKLAKEADGWDPSRTTAGSGKKVKWKCPKGHKFEARLANRTYRKSNCPYCAGSKVLVGFNDLKTKYPKIAKEAFDWDPQLVTAGSGKKLKWKCNYGHIWMVSANQRIYFNSGCPYCSNNKVLSGFNDLARKNPELAAESDGWDPSKVSSKSGATKKWICSLGHKWTAKISDRARGGGCPYCSNRRILKGFNDLMTTHPELADEAYGWKPETVSLGSNAIKKWRCKMNHTWKTSPNSRTNQNSGCPYCSNNKVMAGFNDLSTTHPLIAEQAFRWNPKTISFGSNIKKKWKCPNGHIWIVSPSVRTGKGGSNCPTCSMTGFDPNSDSYLYFLNHPDWEMFQIGITNFPDDRLAIHRKTGWEVLEIRGPFDGHSTQQWETDILRMLKAKGADLSNSKIAGKFDGYSEAWSKSTFPVESIKELMQLTDQFEENK